MTPVSDRDAALALLNVSRETVARLDLYAHLLRKWQPSVQLVSKADLPYLWLRHIADSGQIMRLASPGARIWADIGSGGGFPGLVLAILSPHTGARFHLIESDQRKAAFLRHVSRETGAPAVIHAERAEQTIPFLVGVDVVTSRATAHLRQLLIWADPLLRAGALGLFPKGENAALELTEAEPNPKMDVELEPSLTHARASIVKVQYLLD